FANPAGPKTNGVNPPTTSQMLGISQIVMNGTVSFLNTGTDNNYYIGANTSIVLGGPTNINLSKNDTRPSTSGVYIQGQITSSPTTNLVINGSGLLVLRDVARTGLNGNIII